MDVENLELRIIATFSNGQDKERAQTAVDAAGIASTSEFKAPKVRGVIRASIALHPAHFDKLRSQLLLLLPSAVITSGLPDPDGLLRFLYFSIPAKDQHRLLAIPDIWEGGPTSRVLLYTDVQDRYQLSPLACPRCFSRDHGLQDCPLDREHARCATCGEQGHTARQCASNESERPKQCLICKGPHLTLRCFYLHPTRQPLDRRKLERIAEQMAASDGAVTEPVVTSSPAQSFVHATSYASAARHHIHPTQDRTSTSPSSLVPINATVVPSLPSPSNSISSSSSSNSSSDLVTPDSISDPSESSRLWKAIEKLSVQVETQEQRNKQLIADILQNSMQQMMITVQHQIESSLSQITSQLSVSVGSSPELAFSPQPVPAIAATHHRRQLLTPASNTNEPTRYHHRRSPPPTVGPETLTRNKAPRIGVLADAATQASTGSAGTPPTDRDRLSASASTTTTHSNSCPPTNLLPRQFQ
jgi:hypothetical protein